MVKVALCRFQLSLGRFALFVVTDTSNVGFKISEESFEKVFGF